MYDAGVPDAVMEKLPDPTGFRILLAMAQVSEKTSAGVYLPDEHVGREALASIIGYVLKVGPDAYKDKDRFPEGPYCKVGDWVILKSYSGIRFNLRNNSQNFCLVEDDTIAAVVKDPRELTRI